MNKRAGLVLSAVAMTSLLGGCTAYSEYPAYGYGYGNYGGYGGYGYRGYGYAAPVPTVGGAYIALGDGGRWRGDREWHEGRHEGWHGGHEGWGRHREHWHGHHEE